MAVALASLSKRWSETEERHAPTSKESPADKWTAWRAEQRSGLESPDGPFTSPVGCIMFLCPGPQPPLELRLCKWLAQFITTAYFSVILKGDPSVFYTCNHPQAIASQGTPLTGPINSYWSSYSTRAWPHPRQGERVSADVNLIVGQTWCPLAATCKVHFGCASRKGNPLATSNKITFSHWNTIGLELVASQVRRTVVPSRTGLRDSGVILGRLRSNGERHACAELGGSFNTPPSPFPSSSGLQSNAPGFSCC